MIIERLLHGDKMQMIIQCCNERDQCQMANSHSLFLVSRVYFLNNIVRIFNNQVISFNDE